MTPTEIQTTAESGVANRFKACVCNGSSMCPECNEVEGAKLAAEMRAADARYAVPPCLECGATSPEDAQGKCICGGDKDDCHGCSLWPD